MPLVSGTKVTALTDRSATPRVGTVVRLLGRQQIAGINEGVIDVLEKYLVRWPVPDGKFVEAEAPGSTLVVVGEDGS
jgi:hypothetical protein